MSRYFLIGGGRNEASYVRTYWRFVCSAAAGREKLNIAVVIPVDAKHTEEQKKELEQDARDPFVMFEPIDKDEVHVLFASREEPLTAERLAAVDATGVYVAGNRMSACRDALCTDRGWLDWMRERGVPYCGSGVGAAIASARVVEGGWLIALQHFNCEVASNQCADGRDFAELTEGLGLVPFPIETRAVQAGTLTRLMHLAAEGATNSGWAIDENTMLEVVGDELRVHGPNGAYRVRQLAEGAVRTDIFHAGSVIRRDEW